MVGTAIKVLDLCLELLHMSVTTEFLWKDFVLFQDDDNSSYSSEENSSYEDLVLKIGNSIITVSLFLFY